MKDIIKDYAILLMLVVLFVAMTGSALMLILTASAKWYIITICTTIAAMFAGTRKFDNYTDEELNDEDWS